MDYVIRLLEKDIVEWKDAMRLYKSYIGEKYLAEATQRINEIKKAISILLKAENNTGS